MKRKNLLSLFVAFSMIATYVQAGNWVYNTNTTKWEKNITPDMFQFASQSTAQLQSNIHTTTGGANPNPAITSTSGQNLSNGYFAVTGGQVSTIDTDPVLTNVKNGFNIQNITLGSSTGNFMRFASSAADITTLGGTKTSTTGYFDLNWYIPTKYNYTGYQINFSDSVYNPSTYGLQLLVYDETGTQQGTTQNQSTTGWSIATFTQTTIKPFRFKISIPNTSGLICYYTAPKFLLTSATEPAQRTITVTTSADGTVTPVLPTPLHDQDIQTFTIAPVSGKAIDAVSYNGTTVTPTNNGNGTFTYTTPLITANATLDVTYKDATITSLPQNSSQFILSKENGLLKISNLTAGEKVNIYSAMGQLIHRSVATQASATIALSKGIYIVNIGDKTTKVTF